MSPCNAKKNDYSPPITNHPKYPSPLQPKMTIQFLITYTRTLITCIIPRTYRLIRKTPNRIKPPKFLTLAYIVRDETWLYTYIPTPAMVLHQALFRKILGESKNDAKMRTEYATSVDLPSRLDTRLGAPTPGRGRLNGQSVCREAVRAVVQAGVDTWLAAQHGLAIEDSGLRHAGWQAMRQRHRGHRDGAVTLFAAQHVLAIEDSGPRRAGWRTTRQRLPRYRVGGVTMLAALQGSAIASSGQRHARRKHRATASKATKKKMQSNEYHRTTTTPIASLASL